MSRRHIPLIALAFIIFGTTSLAALAQNCSSNIVATTPQQHYHDNQNGSVTDQLTGLQWSRCSLGQTWENGKCQGEARALSYAIVELVAKQGWRLPTLSELTSLVELRCAHPAINNRIFPTPASAAYWTSTRFASQDGNFWQVQFSQGETVPEKANSVAYVRWVRDN